VHLLQIIPMYEIERWHPLCVAKFAVKH
jgi:hypothetical protein